MQLPTAGADVEQALISCLLQDSELVGPAIREAFGRATASSVWHDRMSSMVYYYWLTEGQLAKELDIWLISEWSEKYYSGQQERVLGELQSMYTKAVSPVNFSRYLPIVKEAYDKRCLMLGLSDVVNKLEAGTSAATAKELTKELLDNTALTKARTLSTGDAITAIKKSLSGPSHGQFTGFPQLDRMLGMTKPGNPITIAARPGAGKTAVMTNWLRRVAGAGHQCAVFSLEMSVSELCGRMIGELAGVENKEEVVFGSEANNPAVVKATEVVQDYNIHWHEGDCTWQAMEARIREWSAAFGLDWLFLDYCQIVSDERPNKSIKERVDGLMSMIRRVSRELGFRPVVLAQINRESDKEVAKAAREGKTARPRMDQIKDTGNLEQDSYVVIVIDTDKVETGELEAKVAAGEAIGMRWWIDKNRGGGVGPVFTRFHPKYSRIDDSRILDEDVPHKEQE